MKYVIPILSLIISVIALAVALPRPNNLGFDYLGVIVALVSIATAMAVGFQIWNALSLEARVQKMYEKIRIENEKNIEELRKNNRTDLKRSNSIIMHSISYWVLSIEAKNAAFRGHYSTALVDYFLAIQHLTKLKNLDITLDNRIKTRIINLMQDHQFTISQESAKKIIKIIIDNKDGDLVNLVPEIHSRIRE